MGTATVGGANPATADGKYREARRRLKAELQRIADEVELLDPDRPEWKPLLDSRRIVGTILILENLFPDKLPPDKLVQKGGYNDVDKAIDDIIGRHKRLAAEKAKTKKVCA
jgi:hypothetical protein